MPPKPHGNSPLQGGRLRAPHFVVLGLSYAIIFYLGWTINATRHETPEAAAVAVSPRTFRRPLDTISDDKLASAEQNPDIANEVEAPTSSTGANSFDNSIVFIAASTGADKELSRAILAQLCAQHSSKRLYCVGSGCDSDEKSNAGCSGGVVSTSFAELKDAKYSTSWQSSWIVVSGASSEAAECLSADIPTIYIHGDDTLLVGTPEIRADNIIAAIASAHVVTTDAQLWRMRRAGIPASHILHYNPQRGLPADPLDAAIKQWLSATSTTTATFAIDPQGKPTSLMVYPPHPPPTYHEVMSAPSSFSLDRASAPEFGITVIISFYRRAWTLPLMVKRLAGGTVPPREMWLTAFDAEVTAELQEEMKKLFDDPEIIAIKNRLGDRMPAIKFQSGNIHLAYFGRFMMAIGAKTPFVAIWDDDTVPGGKVLHTLLHMAHQPFAQNSVIASRGHNLQCPILEDWHFSGRNPVVVEEDVVGGFWFAPTDLYKLLFRDRMISWETSEDSQFCAAVRKYTGRPCLICPMNEKDPETTTQDPEFEGRASAGDTTLVYNKMPLRTRITRHIFMRGATIRLRQKVQHANGVMVFIDTCEHAKTIGSVFRTATGAFQRLPREAYYMAGSGVCPAGDEESQFPSGLFHHSWLTMDCTGNCAFINTDYGPFDLELSSHIPGATRSIDVVNDAFMTGQSVLELIMPRVVVLAFEDTPAVVGFALAARYLNIPVIAFGEPKLSQKDTLLSLIANNGALSADVAMALTTDYATR